MNTTDTTTTPVRMPVTYLNYPGGDLTESIAADIDSGRGFGPAYGSNELLYPVTATYDPDTNVTRVGFSYIAPPPTTD